MAAELHKIHPTEPHNEFAEKCVLGAVLADNAVFRRLDGTLHATDFYVGLHGEVFGAVADLVRADRRADLITLAPVLHGKTVFEVDAEDYVRGLVEQAPETTEQLVDYVREVLQYSAQRGVIATARTLGAEAARRGVNLIEAYDTAVKALDTAIGRAAKRRVTVKFIPEWAQDALDEYAKGTKGTSSGLVELDKLIGGFFPGDLCILGGRPSQGKTALALEIGLAVARGRGSDGPHRGVGVHVESMEMGGIPLAQRVLSSVAYDPIDPIPYNAFRRQELKPDHIARLKAAKTSLDEVPLVINTQPAMTLAEITASVRRSQMQLEAKGRKLGLIVIDYLGLIQLSNRWGDNRAYAIAEATGRLKEMAIDMQLPILLLHQLNRDVEASADKRPQMHHLRESGNIEQDADVVMFVYRDEYYIEREGVQRDTDKEGDRQRRLEAARNKMEIIVRKNRMGQIGTAEVGCAIGSNYVWDLDDRF
jgi:replicative DNA helicase